MARADLYVEEFDTLINQKGIECQYYPAIVCQCISEDSGQPNYNCPYCGGSGFRYLLPKNLRVLVTSLSGKSFLDILGLKESGTVYATPTSDTIMGFHDRLVFPKFKCKYSERIIFRQNEMVSSKTYRNIVEVETILIDGNVLELDKDFKVSEDTYHIELLSTVSELVEKSDINASILYYTNPSYLVEDLLHELRATYTERYVPKETYKELPKQYKLVREDFVYNTQGSDENGQY